MPYGRISQVRFEVLAMRLPWAFPAWRGLSADSQYAPTSMVCPRIQFHLIRRLIVGTVSDCPAERRSDQVPRVSLPNVGVTSTGETCTVS